MIYWDDIAGQNNAVRYLTGLLRSGRMPRSYLFWGPEGVGKALTAKVFICEAFKSALPQGQDALCDRVFENTHPDVIWTRPEESGAIKIETIRDIIGRLNLKPQRAPYMVCVIEDAHLLTVEASNAFLKLLEEPPGKGLLILITHKRELLLSTVISRTAQVRFARLPEEETVRIISPLLPDMSPDDIRTLAELSQGSPGAAFELARNEKLGRLEELAEWIAEAEESEDNAQLLGLESADRESLSEDIELLIMLLRAAAMGRAGTKVVNRPFGALNEDQLYQRLETLVRAKKALQGNCNMKLLKQSLAGKLCGGTS